MTDQQLKDAALKAAALISNLGHAGERAQIAVLALVTTSRSCGVPDQMIVDALEAMYRGNPRRVDA
jgi:hypothetical protein